jgi:hypothetical protein
MRLHAVLLVGIGAVAVSACSSRDGETVRSPTAATVESTAATEDGGSASKDAISCFLNPGQVTVTGLGSLQASASISCSPASSSLYIQGTIERASTTSGPWSYWAQSSRYGSGTYLDTITSGVRTCGYYYRMNAYGQWYDSGSYFNKTKVGTATWVPCP